MTTESLAAGLGRPAEDDSDRLLRLVLRLDAAGSGACGLLAAAGAPVLDGPLGAPTALLVPVGLFLLAYAAGVWFVASRPRLSRPAVWAVIAFNLAWVLESVLLVAAGWFSLTGAGVTLVLAQAAAVAVLADLQFLGLRRSRPAAG